MRRRYLVWKIPSKPGGDYAHWKPLLRPQGLAVHAVGDQAVVHRFGDGHARGALHFLGAFSDEGRSGCTSDLALLWNLPLADGASVAIPKFADVKHSGYKPFTFAAGAGRCHSWRMNVSAMTRLVSTFPEALGALVIFSGRILLSFPNRAVITF